MEEPQDSSPKRNLGDLDIPITIEDIRGQESLYSLDENALTTLKTGSSAEKDFFWGGSIREKYFPEIEQLFFENVPGAKRIFLFDYTLRPIGGDRPPVLRVHIDQNQKAAFGRVHHFLPDEAEALLKNRVRITNVWRPLNGHV